MIGPEEAERLAEKYFSRTSPIREEAREIGERALLQIAGMHFEYERVEYAGEMFPHRRLVGEWERA